MKRYYHLYQFAFPRQAHEFMVAAALLAVGIVSYSALLTRAAYAAAAAAADSAESAVAVAESTVPTVVEVKVTPPPVPPLPLTPTAVVDVRLDSTSPPAGSVLPGSQGVVFTIAKLTTTNGTVQVNSLEVAANPPGAVAVTNVKLFDASGVQLGQTIPAFPSGTATPLAEVSGAAFELSAGSTKFITIRADVLPTANGAVALSLSRLTYTGTTSVIIRGMPVVGQTMQLTSLPPPPPPRPDLVVTSVRLLAASQQYAGKPFDADDVTVVVKNQGEAAAEATNLRLNVLDVQTNQLQCSWLSALPALGPGGQRTVAPSHGSFMNCPNLAARSYYLEASVDVSPGSANTVVESNETNNTTRSDSVTVLPLVAAPQVSGVSLVKLAQSGTYAKQRISFTVTSGVGGVIPSATTLLYRDDTLYNPAARAYTDSRLAVSQGGGAFYVDLPMLRSQVTHYAIVVNHTNVITPDYVAEVSSLVTSVYLPSNLQLYAGYPFFGDDVTARVVNQGTQALLQFDLAFNVRAATSDDLQCSWSWRVGGLAVGRTSTIRVAPTAFLNCPVLTQQSYYLEVVPTLVGQGTLSATSARTQAFAVRPQSEAPVVGSVSARVFSATKAQVTFKVAASSSPLPQTELLYSNDPAYVYNATSRRYNKSRTALRISGGPWSRVDLPLHTGTNHYAIHVTRTNVVTPDYSL